ncbi:PBSX family phage terminase large subunit [Sporolactobacillus shoreicorticis]|uniref:PBSX family phage terminase large subunit n=1 Tax=Sporolactobacillus shoreicorticis TaxID=1923877 RepID=A0ABW5S7R7_9BACL|nr:PBSX family phage terminase large subunit [Sporolactobacillus shoreicorticis]MCO7127800.1 PBSX family phage terminase large subunit [Sporolactobacillus shoreicorticis]
MKKNKGFQFKPFSDQQIKLLTWWLPGVSPYADYDGIIAEGSIRAGKTIAMIDSFLTWSLETFDGESFILGGKTMGALKRNVLNPLFQILVAKGIAYKYIRSDDPHVEIGNNIYYLFGGDNEKSQDKVQGLTAAGAYLDEAALMPKSFVDQVMGRCSVDGAKYFFNCNPGHPKHWLKVEIIDHAKEKNFLVLHFTMDDNLTLSKKVKERLKRMFSGVFYLRYILGQWVVAEGLVYDMFKEKEHVISHDKVQKMLDDHEFYRFIGGVDWGYRDPMVGGVYGLPRGKVKAIKIAEFYKTKQHTEDLAKWFIEWQKKLGTTLKVIYCDSAEQDRIDTLRLWKLHARNADKEIGAGLNTVMTMIQNGEYLICEDCKETINEMLIYSYPGPDDPAAKKDQPLDENNHAMDESRYVLHSYFRKRK